MAEQGEQVRDKATAWRGLAWGQRTVPQLRKGERVPVDSERLRPREGPSRAGLAEGGYVRTWKGCSPVKGTHELGIAERERACQMLRCEDTGDNRGQRGNQR